MMKSNDDEEFHKFFDSIGLDSWIEPLKSKYFGFGFSFFVNINLLLFSIILVIQMSAFHH